MTQLNIDSFDAASYRESLMDRFRVSPTLHFINTWGDAALLAYAASQAMGVSPAHRITVTSTFIDLFIDDEVEFDGAALRSLLDCRLVSEDQQFHFNYLTTTTEIVYTRGIDEPTADPRARTVIRFVPVRV